MLEGGHWSPLGQSGQFYFENLPDGPLKGSVRVRETEFLCVLVIPTSDESLVALGEITCAAGPGRQE